jgi:hypothetical protein
MKGTECEFNPLNAELNPICHLPALLGAHHILHVSRIRVKLTIVHALSLSVGRAVSESNFIGVACCLNITCLRGQDFISDIIFCVFYRFLLRQTFTCTDTEIL